MNHGAIIETAARALRELRVSEAEYAAVFVLDIVTPLIRAAALEEAAQVAEEDKAHSWQWAEVAAAIRSLKDQP